MWNLARIWVNSNNYTEEEIAGKQEVHIHKEVTSVVLHEITKEIGEVENEQGTVKQGKCDDWISDDDRIP